MADFELHLDPRTGEPMDLRGPSELNEALARIKTNARRFCVALHNKISIHF